ncbi:MAG: zinc ribbon domain-containing protein [Treponema sp.]|jgi:putative FmdB family regulatory protein|nr:zinc ribbon domain-containing protein [Treponema sp.]
MPTYGYECKNCGHTFDVFQSMSDEPLKTCPQCGKELRRLINGGTGIIFKGPGFYVTDKKGGTGAAAGASKTPAKPDSVAKPDSAAPAPACPGCAAAAETGSCPKAVNS